MSSHLREDKTCQNCGYTVEKAYCTDCGQKNTETRQPFHHLFTHFVEDLTHYDGAFWKTISHLLFRPARLTKEYLQGKRQTYVPPVKLYIFISFVTFFFMSITKVDIVDRQVTVKEVNIAEQNINDTVVKIDSINVMGYHSLKTLDSVQKYGTDEEKLPGIIYKAARGMFRAHEKGMSGEDMLKQYIQLVPKILFIYLPIFTFWLWLFHSKKKWYFFDHGIFTLHYFSAVLLLYLIDDLFEEILILLLPDKIAESISIVISVVTMAYAFFYFFRAHKSMYKETRLVSVLKGILLFFTNMFWILVAVFCSAIYFFSNIH